MLADQVHDTGVAALQSALDIMMAADSAGVAMGVGSGSGSSGETPIPSSKLPNSIVFGIVGGVIGGLAVLLVLVFVVTYCCCKRHKLEYELNPIGREGPSFYEECAMGNSIGRRSESQADTSTLPHLGKMLGKSSSHDLKSFRSQSGSMVRPGSVRRPSSMSNANSRSSSFAGVRNRMKETSPASSSYSGSFSSDSFPSEDYDAYPYDSPDYSGGYNSGSTDDEGQVSPMYPQNAYPGPARSPRSGKPRNPREADRQPRRNQGGPPRAAAPTRQRGAPSRNQPPARNHAVVDVRPERKNSIGQPPMRRSTSNGALGSRPGSYRQAPVRGTGSFAGGEPSRPPGVRTRSSGSSPQGNGPRNGGGREGSFRGGSARGSRRGSFM